MIIIVATHLNTTRNKNTHLFSWKSGKYHFWKLMKFDGFGICCRKNRHFITYIFTRMQKYEFQITSGKKPTVYWKLIYLPLEFDNCIDACTLYIYKHRITIKIFMQYTFSFLCWICRKTLLTVITKFVGVAFIFKKMWVCLFVDFENDCDDSSIDKKRKRNTI